MKTGFLEFLFFSVVVILSWYIVESKIFPTLPTWTTPIIAITIGAIAQTIRYIGALEEQNLETKILLAITQSEQRICEVLGTKIDNLSARVSKLEGKDEVRKELQKAG